MILSAEVSRMDWREKLIWVGLGLVLISWGLVIVDVWSVLMAHLTKNNWIMLALVYPAVLLALISVYHNTPKGTRLRGQVLFATTAVIISWAEVFALIGKIGH
jgi:hypothetical protein